MITLSIRGATIHRSKRPVVQDASFTAPAGALTALLGPAGAGKTTLLAAIAGLIRLERGAILRDGIDITRLPPRRRGIAMLPPGTILADPAGVASALRRLARTQAPALLAGLGLTSLAGQDMTTLSHGEALLCLTAARLAPSSPRAGPEAVLLLDEAAAGLDDAATDRLLALLRARAGAGGTVLVATRQAAIGLAADHLVLLADGRVLQAGPPASLYAEPRDAACALLTGPANILSGQIREVRPGGFVWSAGRRFVQAAGPGSTRPTLGSPVSLCLRPERIALLAPGEVADNELEAQVTGAQPAAGSLHVRLDSPVGPIALALPAWPSVPPVAYGQRIRVGWAAGACSILPG